jgi:DNA polymerase-3 subunit gamma/tau
MDAIASSNNIEAIWKKVLSAVQPYTTQTLLRQHCHLISFEGAIAHVGVSSQPLLELAQKKLPNIEAAFEAVYKSKVKVTLKTNSMMPPNTATPNEPTVRRIVKEPTSQAAISQPVTDDSSTPKSRQVLPVLEEGKKGIEVNTQKGRDGENTALLEKENPRIHPRDRSDFLTDSPKAPSVQDIDLDAEDIEKALGNLKQFFEGEIVDLSDDWSKREPASTQLLESENGIDDDTERLEVELEEDQNELSFSQPAPTQQWQASELAALENAEVQKRLEVLEYDEDGNIAF